MKTQRRYFTLLETLIAISLTVLILSTVTYFYQQMDSMNNKSEAIQRETFKMLNMENRLMSIFPRAVGEINNQDDFYFFTVSDPSGIFKQGSSKSLVFSYNNGVDYNKAFSNHVLGELFLDPQGRLILATWPVPDRWNEGVNPPIKKEVLLDDVDSFTMGFFIPPDKKWKLEEPTKGGSAGQAKKISTPTLKPSPEGAWVEEWNNDYHLLPGLIRLEIKRKGMVEYYVFPFPYTDRQIVYNQ